MDACLVIVIFIVINIVFFLKERILLLDWQCLYRQVKHGPNQANGRDGIPNLILNLRVDKCYSHLQYDWMHC
jgi:hypothetical protein